MDFRLTLEQEALKKKFDEFFKEEMKKASQGWLSSIEFLISEEGYAFHRRMAKKLAEKGWLIRHWPKEYGGQDAPIIEQLLFSEAIGYHRAVGVDPYGMELLAPTLFAVGTEEQKREHLLPLARAEKFWCQGFSEPNAGSDVASLTTSAARNGDDYIINGQKTWISCAHHADWMFLLARTNPEEKRSRGLSYFLLDMKTPGITIRPIYTMEGSHHFNEVHFDDVRVPATNMVGEENRGWDVARATMNFERSNVKAMVASKRDLEEMVEFCKETEWNGKTLAQDPFVRHSLAQLAIEIEVGRAMSYRIAWIQQKEGLLAAAHAASAAKVYGSELTQRLAYTAWRIMGLYGQVKKGSKWAPLLGKFERLCQFFPELNIGGGSSEIQRNLIAWIGLQLPRTI